MEKKLFSRDNKRQLICFNDLILVCKQDGEHLKCVFELSLEGAHLRLAKDPAQIQLCSDSDQFTCWMSSAEELNEWLQKLKTLIESATPHPQQGQNAVIYK